ncbi:phage major capsid protein [uncultured Parasphingorhabdus sp.]|uniref:phage major capsid protein n=1 Tax=uncultured Parasphingorhabdus sp. TaxID=2709694 RepID=UPI0030D8DE65|tara:strand:+ start:19791 stop:20963 length:1173 start_codon:yes stop_codon:yes gene_type:complete
MELSPETPLETKAEPLEASFDAVLIAEETENHGKAIATLRGDVDGLKGQVDAIGKVAARPALDGAKGMPTSPAAQDFVTKYLRRGEQAGVELKSFSGASGPEGGFAVPQEIDALIGATLKDISPIRSIATVVRTGSAGYRKLVTTGGTPSGWVSETAGRPETDTPDFNEIAPPSGELYANPAASQAMLDDAAFDVESWLADEIAREFAQAEGAAFVGGSGVNQPRGFLNAAVTDESDDIRDFGSLQYVPSGASGSFDSEDVLVDLVHTLRPAYRQGASFVMNSSTLAHIRKFKTADGAFLWQPSLASGQPATLLGYPVVEAEDMPDIAADSLSIAFGNFRAGYLIAERSATSILRDPFTNKPFVHFYATRRVGGQIMNSEAIKLMQFSAS